MPWLVMYMGGLPFSEEKVGERLRGRTKRRGGNERKMWSGWEKIINCEKRKRKRSASAARGDHLVLKRSR